MTTAAIQLQATLAAHAPLAALVGTRIASDAADPAWPMPYVVYTQVGSVPYSTIDNTTLAEDVSFEVVVWAKQRSVAEAIATHCRTAIEDAGESVASRSGGYDDELDAEAVVLAVQWYYAP